MIECRPGRDRQGAGSPPGSRSVEGITSGAVRWTAPDRAGGSGTSADSQELRSLDIEARSMQFAGGAVCMMRLCASRCGLCGTRACLHGDGSATATNGSRVADNTNSSSTELPQLVHTTVRRFAANLSHLNANAAASKAGIGGKFLRADRNGDVLRGRLADSGRRAVSDGHRLRRGSRCERIATPHGLIEIHNCAGHHSRVHRGKECDCPGNFRRIQEPSEGLLGSGFLQPVIRRAVVLALDPVFAIRSHPSDVELVYPNPVAQQGECRVARLAWQARSWRRNRRI